MRNQNAIMICLAVASPASLGQSPAPKTIAAMRDHYRPVLIFAADTDTRLTEQVNALTKHGADLAEREVMLVPNIHTYAGSGPWTIMTFMGSEEPTLRRRFRVPPSDFTVILLGKDGTEKFRAHTLITIDQLNSLIDAMPMRQAEMHPRQAPAKLPQ